jgi:RNA polymerase sigma factor (sigma-70 family)
MLPEPVAQLLRADTPDDEAEAWARFLVEYSRLILSTARGAARDADDAMDSYAYVLERLRADRSARLRNFASDGRARFTTWLVVVARRLCVDHHRSRYGRLDTDRSQETRVARRQVNDLLGAAIDLDALPARSSAPDLDIRRLELREALDAALARLDGRDRLLLSLRFEEEMSASGIARAMSFPTQFHVYRRLNHVLGLLREELLARGFRESTP